MANAEIFECMKYTYSLVPFQQDSVKWIIIKAEILCAILREKVEKFKINFLKFVHLRFLLLGGNYFHSVFSIFFIHYTYRLKPCSFLSSQSYPYKSLPPLAPPLLLKELGAPNKNHSFLGHLVYSTSRGSYCFYPTWEKVEASKTSCLLSKC